MILGVRTEYIDMTYVVVELRWFKSEEDFQEHKNAWRGDRWEIVRTKE